VLKYNGNQRYATTAITAAILREVASQAEVPLQVKGGSGRCVVCSGWVCDMVRIGHCCNMNEELKFS